MNGMNRNQRLAIRCNHEVWDGNVDDPSYAYCDLRAAHAGEHHYTIEGR